jgi:hypothetical protein
MLLRAITFLATMVLATVCVTCTPLPETAAPSEGDLTVERLVQPDAIPAEWGNLISANQTAGNRYTWLWFQDEQGNLRLVVFNNRVGRLQRDAVLIRRN